MGTEAPVAPEAVIKSGEVAREFILAGRAVFTVRNPATENRITFKVTGKPSDKNPKETVWFVSVLTGPDNTSSFTFLGTIFPDGNYKRSLRSRISGDARSALAFDWAWRRIGSKKELTHGAELWHSGHCGRCGRVLTVPESLATGLGPICIDKAHQ